MPPRSLVRTRRNGQDVCPGRPVRPAPDVRPVLAVCSVRAVQHVPDRQYVLYVPYRIITRQTHDSPAPRDLVVNAGAPGTRKWGGQPGQRTPTRGLRCVYISASKLFRVEARASRAAPISPSAGQRSTADELNAPPQTRALSGGPADGGLSNLISGGVIGYILWRAAEVPVQNLVHGGGRSR